jgi:hypothetical protein
MKKPISLLCLAMMSACAIAPDEGSATDTDPKTAAAQEPLDGGSIGVRASFDPGSNCNGGIIAIGDALNTEGDYSFELYRDGTFIQKLEAKIDSCAANSAFCQQPTAVFPIDDRKPGNYQVKYKVTTKYALFFNLNHTGDSNVVAVPSTPGCPAPDFEFSSNGPISGRTCISVNETADHDSWQDNFFCSTRNLGLAWSSAGPIPGMACTQIAESADPHTWLDNYLCAPSNYGFQWSSAGPIYGMTCVQWYEPADPNSWSDNFLCY